MPINDRQASELISQSFRRELSDAEAKHVEEHLSQDADSRAFARLSRLIHSSMSDIAVTTELGDETVSPGMSAVAKERLRKSVRLAVEQKQSRSCDSPAASAATDSSVPDTAAPDTAAPDTAAPDTAAPDTAAASALAHERGGGEEQRAVARPKSTRSSRQLVSRFTLIHKLGEGGLGAVWLARDEKLKRTVAIKEMNAEAAESPKAWQRFHREAEITGYLEHPNIVPLYQFGADPKSGQPFYAMRFVGKRTLADAIIEYHERRLAGDENVLELHRLLTAFIGICQAVAYAHSRGVIHRDLKPENVAIDNFGQVIVLDWGLAKLTDDAELTTQLTTAHEADDIALARTLAGEVIGTPLYMAPEQAAGNLNNVDEKTDIYGLGAILFAILTGCAPHENSNTTQSGNLQVEDLLKAIAEGETPTPRDFNAGVSGDLESICMKAMSRKRYARHGSAAELADDVQRWMANRRHKQQQYDNMRLEGRELRANVLSFIRDLSTNVRFMANLPPIQGIINARAERTTDEEHVWRERLAIIYKGLLQANADFSAITYYSVQNSEFTEIVRIERHSTDRANVRSVPRSRLVAGEANAFMQTAMHQKPKEVFVALTAEAAAVNGAVMAASDNRKLSAGVPVFDQHTEEPFGLVVIEGDLQRIIEAELRERIRTAKQVFVITPKATVWLHESRDGGPLAESVGLPAANVLHSFEQLSTTLAKHTEFVDEANRELYATRLHFTPNGPGWVFVLDRRPPRD